MRTGPQYLLRFDDMCPTMSRAGWARFVPLLERYGVKPVLAVVPENVDPELMWDAEDQGFWAEMCTWQARGATIGLHGWRHDCGKRGGRGGLLPLHAGTEFVGLEMERQQEWLRLGLNRLREHGLEPRIWVAPRHGLDGNTLRALKTVGMDVISDGLGRRLVRRGDCVWLPQQLWEPVEQPDGLWTICMHANTAGDALVRRLEDFLERNAGCMTSLERVLAEWPVVEYGVMDWVVEQMVLWRRRLRGYGTRLR